MGLNTGNKIASYMNTKIKLNERLVAGAYSTFALVLDDKDGIYTLQLHWSKNEG